MKTKTLFILINSLECGGAERVAVILSEEMLKMNVKVFLILLEDKNRFYKVPDAVNVISLGSNKVLKSILKLRKHIIKYNPDTVLSFLTRSNYINVLCSLLTPNYFCVISERIYTSKHYSTGIFSKVNRFIIKVLYPLSDKVIAVSGEVSEDLCNNFGVCTNTITINNPYDIDRINNSALTANIVTSQNYICSVGRLEKQKAYDFLISSYMQTVIDEDLVIVGAGSQEKYLKKIVSDNSYETKIHFTGLQSNPFPVIKNARCFILSSINEGFPNVLLEAMCLGVPVIATNCNPVTESILNGKASNDEPVMAEFGILVPVNNIIVMKKAIEMICKDASLRNHYKEMSLLRAGDFSAEKISSEYYQNIFAGN